MAKKLKKYIIKSSIPKYKIPASKGFFWKKLPLLAKFNGLTRKKKIIYSIALIFLTLIIIRMSAGFAFKKKPVEEIAIIPVNTTIAKLDNIRDAIYLTERLEAQSDVNVLPPVPGWVNTINVDIGSKVGKYQVLATIDRNIVGGEYVNAIVKSPIAGEVGQIFVDKGANVSPQTPIMNIINYDTIKIYVNIPEKYMGRVQKGDVALIKLESLNSQDEFIGSIEKVSSVINTLTGTFQAKIVIPNGQHKLKPGGFANIKVILNIKKAVIISKEALVETEGLQPYVYKIRKDPLLQEQLKKLAPYLPINIEAIPIEIKAEKIYIQKGIEEENNVEITQGIQENDVVITTGKEIVKNGSRVFIADQPETQVSSPTNNKSK